MPARSSLIASAEAAFIAGLSDRHMNRVIDEDLVPKELFERQGSTRRFTRLCAAFANFYFDTESVLIAGARRQALEELTQRVLQSRTSDEVLALSAPAHDVNWKVVKHAVEIDLTPYIATALVRARNVDEAGALVSSAPDIMGGAEVFAGTRVPIDIVLSSLDAGIGLDRLRASYPFLTDAHIQAARVYRAVHPKRGRPRRSTDLDVAATHRVRRVVRPAPA